MRLVLPLIFGLIAGCAKHEVDIDAMNTSPFDPDWSGPSFIQIDSVVTIAVIPGAVFKQRVYLQLPPALTVGHFSIRAIETTVPDTIFGSSSEAPAVHWWFDNQQVLLGNEYCYDIDVIVGNEPLTNHRISPCYVVEN